MQTRIIAGARMYVGTCGSLAWLAPLLGVPTLPVFTDASFLHAHLHVARRVYGRVGAATFSPVDLTGMLDAGLAIGAATSTGTDVAVVMRIPNIGAPLMNLAGVRLRRPSATGRTCGARG